jgi:16S rRNA (guanine(527)-N(7))-methyltransferase RsmG
MYGEALASGLRRFAVDPPPEDRLVLADYCNELERWNRRMNLTSLRGPAMVRRLVVEPLWVAQQLRPRGVLADVGSGNGSPAIPLHVAAKFSQVHLTEPRAKRAAFLQHVTTALNLRGVAVHRSRFEKVFKGLGHLDWVTLQGFALTTELLEMIRGASSAPNVVWITSGRPAGAVRSQRDWGARAGMSIKPSLRLEIPITGSQVFVFGLDHS